MNRERVAFVFPGQGSQSVGMGRDLYEHSPAARRVFKAVDAACGWAVSRLCFEGPEEALRDTQGAQPALLAAALSSLAACQEAGLSPAAAAGHSVGEYAALVAAGALSVESGARLAKARGEAMAEAARARAGAMSAVLGLDAAAVAESCRQVNHVGVVVVANLNAPGQVVISGESAAVEAAGELCKQRGAKRLAPLAVSGAFHSPLMEMAAVTMRGVLALTDVADPGLLVVANVTADYVRTGAEVRACLAAQVAGPVRWVESVGRLAADGYTTFVECGPGAVLAGLIKRIAPQATTYGVSDKATLIRAKEALT